MPLVCAEVRSRIHNESFKSWTLLTGARCPFLALGLCQR